MIAAMQSYEDSLKVPNAYWLVHWSNDNKHMFAMALPYYLSEDEFVDYL